MVQCWIEPSTALTQVSCQVRQLKKKVKAKNRTHQRTIVYEYDSAQTWFSNGQEINLIIKWPGRTTIDNGITTLWDARIGFWSQLLQHLVIRAVFTLPRINENFVSGEIYSALHSLCHESASRCSIVRSSIGRITRPSRPSVRLSRCPSVTYELVARK